MDGVIMIKEEFIKLGKGKNLIGVFTKPFAPTEGPAILLLNAGLIHRVGPNNIYVKLARRLAEEGYRVLRFDNEGLGDSIPIRRDNSCAGADKDVANIIESMDTLESKWGIKSFILTGICLGAEFAYQVALKDKRVTGLYLINGTGLSNEDFNLLYPLAEKHIQERYYKKSIFQVNKWRNLISKKKLQILEPQKFIKLTKRILTKSVSERPSIAPVGHPTFQEIMHLIRRNVKIAFAVSEGSTVYDLLKLTYLSDLNKGEYDISFRLIKNVDHIFTPAWSHSLLSQELNEWVKGNFPN